MRNTEESPARFVTDVAPPPAPAWFVRNLEERPAQSYVRVAAADIEMLCWGERGRPGVLLIHGSRAHANWWSPIAPFLARRWRVAAFSLSGMGGSGWRPS